MNKNPFGKNGDFITAPQISILICGFVAPVTKVLPQEQVTTASA